MAGPGVLHARGLHARNNRDWQMSGDFQRGLSNGLLQDLLHGPSGLLLRACRSAGLDVRLRADYLNLYFRGRSLARIVGRRRHPAKLEIHHKYVAVDRIGGCVGRRSGSYCAFDVDAAFAEAYAAHLGALIKRAGRYAGPEEDVELCLLERNGDAAAVCCFDRQIQVPGTRRTVDLMGFLAGQVPSLLVIEVKRYPDRRIQDVPRQLHEYLEIFDPTGEGLRDDVARSYRTVCEQLRTLGLPAPDPARITVGMPVKGLVIVSNYNPRSRLLPRAHELAATLGRPMHLWQPADGEFLIPALDRCVRLGPG